MTAISSNFHFTLASTGEELNFTVTNAKDQDLKSLTSALTYLENSSTAVSTLTSLYKLVTNPEYPSTPFTINIIHDGNNRYLPGSNTLNWDPNAANIVYSVDSNRVLTAIGVQSAALGFIHEAAHATDPHSPDYQKQTNKQYDDNGEEYAVGQEDIVAQELGSVQNGYNLNEPIRSNHKGNEDIDLNPTDHTVFNAAKNIYSWSEQILDGTVTITAGNFSPGLVYAYNTPHNYSGNPAKFQGNTITVDNAIISIANDVRDTVKVNGKANKVNYVNNTVSIDGNEMLGFSANDNLTVYFIGSTSNSLDYEIPTTDSSVVTIENTNVEGLASISIADSQITGGTADGVANQWKGPDDTLYQFIPVSAGDFGYGQLDITVDQSLPNANAGDQIIIDNFNMNAAQNGGYLGLTFAKDIAIVPGSNRSADQFLTGDYSAHAQTTNLSSGALRTFTIYASSISDQPQTVTLALTGGNASAFAIDTGDNLLPFSSGGVTLTIPAGADSVTAALVNTQTVTQNQTLQLTATLG